MITPSPDLMQAPQPLETQVAELRAQVAALAAAVANPELGLSRRKAAKAISVSETTLWRLEARGLIKPTPGVLPKIYPVAELQRFLKEGDAV